MGQHLETGGNMIKSMIAVTLVSACVAACGQAPPAQSPPPATQAATPAPAPAAGQADAAATPSSTPAAAASSAAAPATAAPATTPAASAAVPASPPPAAAPAVPPPPPEPTYREVTIPAGTSMSVKMLSSLASNTSKPEDPVKGSIAKAVNVSGTTALPAGTQILGTVTEAAESGRVKGRAMVEFRFERLVVDDETIRIHTASVKHEAASDTKSDVKKGGLGAGLGAVVGGVIGGGKGAAIGAVAGGTGTVLATKGKEVEVPAGTVVSVLVQDPITVRVRVR
jgi:hypothetical protein